MSSANTETRAATELSAMGCLHQRVTAQAALRPSAQAVSAAGTTLTYAELEQQAGALAGRLRADGVRPGAYVGLCVARSVEMPVAMLGILKAGCAYVPLDPAYPGHRLAEILDQARPTRIVSSPGFADRLPGNAPRSLEALSASTHTTFAPIENIDPEQTCYVMFTSGSSGTPKGVTVTHRNVTRLFDQLCAELQLSSTDVWAQAHSYAFGFSVWEIFGALLHGAHLVIADEQTRLDPPRLIEFIRESGTTVFSQTPSAFRRLLQPESMLDSCPSLRLIMLSGEPVPDEDINRWLQLPASAGARLYSSYAVTETGGQVALRRFDSTAPADLAGANGADIGRPLGDTPVWVLDTQRQPVQPGEIGELCVGGPGVASGYLHAPDLTAERFVELQLDGRRQRVYLTGDHARLQADGRIEFIGRSDQQIKLRGYRIEPGDIEAQLAARADIRECAVAVKHTGASEPQLVAYLVAAAAPLISELRAALATTLPDYMVPARFVFLDQLPLTPSGKLDRLALPSPGRERPELGTEFVQPTLDNEIKLAAMWSRLLDIDPVGLDDDFFALGGDSIIALRLVTELGQTFGGDFSVAQLLDAPTVRELAGELLTDAPDVWAAGAGPPADRDATKHSALNTLVSDEAAQYEPFPLTEIQQAYWAGRGSDFALGNVATHLYIEVDAPQLDLDRLEGAWRQVIDRHPMLRAVIHADGTQRILAEVPAYRVAVQDLRTTTEAGIAAALQRERERLSHQVLSSAHWPLFELSASRLPDGVTRLHISLDCLITDARSLQIISNELLHFYSGDSAPLPRPHVSFRDYVLGVQRLRATPAYHRAMQYWRERLQTLPAMPQLPLSQAPEQVREPRFMQRTGGLPPAAWAQLQARAAAARVTPTAVLLQCFGETLAAWCRSAELTLNLTLFNRLPLHPDIDDVVGDFTSLLLLAIHAGDDASFAARVQRVQRELWQSLDHRLVSGIEVLRERARQQGTPQHTMPVVFTSTLGLGTGGEDSMAWHRLGDQVYSVSQTPQVWLDHVVGERAGGLHYSWDVVEALFPPGLIDDLFAAYGRRLSELATHPQAWDRDWTDTWRSLLLPPAQRKRRAVVNATSAPAKTMLLQAGFVERAARQPSARAVWSAERTLSYRQLDELSNRLAHRLQAAGARPDTLVAIVLEKGWRQIVGVLGILKAGAAYLPVDPALPTPRLQYLLEHGGVSLALTSDLPDTGHWPERVQPVPVGVSALESWPATPVDCPARPTDLAYVIFTSGSTGRPKGVMIEHQSAANTCNDINARLQLNADDRLLALSALSFDLSVYDIFGVLAAGGIVVLPAADGLDDPAHWAQLIASQQVSVWNSVPALLELLVDFTEHHPESLLDTLRATLLSGDWIPLTLPGRLRALTSAEVLSLGGATEASIWSIAYPVNSIAADWSSIPYGKPLRNQSLQVLNDQLLPCPDWVPGELYIGGSGLARGYWRDPVKTRQQFITHPQTGERLYRTGDLGRYRPDGNIEFLGREDFQVKVQGYRVELGEIEAALLAHPRVGSAVAAAAGEPHGPKQLIGYFVAAGPTPQADELRSWVAARLPEYMVPSTLIALQQLPLTPNGKVDRAALPAVSTVVPADAQAPAHGVTATVSRIVADILGCAAPEPGTNLLQLGATSIEMIRIANALDRELGLRPRMDDIYRAPTVGGLAAMLEGAADATAAADTDPLLTPAALLRDVSPVHDPEARARLKEGRPGLRRFEMAAPRVSLGWRSADLQAWKQHRSQRQFSQEAVPLAQIAALLESLRSVEIDSASRFRYASAGGLYAVHCYLYVKPERVSDCPGGSYYFAPDLGELVRVGPVWPELREAYDPLVNRPIFDQAAFAVYLAADMRVIGALYPEHALHYAVLEAGHMTQLLESTARAATLGLCQTGGIEQAPLQPLLALESGMVLVHGLLGGSPACAPGSAQPSAGIGRDEGEL